METRTLGILGAISSLVVLPGMAVGAPAMFQPAVGPAHSFAELLDPIPNAVERLRMADAQDAATPRLIKAQYNDHHHHNHHHHHAYVVAPRYHPYYRRHVYHYGYRYGYSPHVIAPYVAPYQDHHHHHHHHHQQDGY